MTAPRILVVDDEPSMRTTLAATLELEGFSVAEASSGDEAMAMIERDTFALVLSDIQMPGIHGVELLRRIKRDHPTLPVVLMSGYAVEHLQEQAIRDGVYTVLTKPFGVEAASQLLLRAIERPIVLLVGDARAGVELVEALAALGIAARSVGNAETAIAALAEHQIDACLVDLSTPENASDNVVERIIERDRTVIVIALTDLGSDQAIWNAVAAGAFMCLLKPIDAVVIARAISKARAASVG